MQSSCCYQVVGIIFNHANYYIEWQRKPYVKSISLTSQIFNSETMVDLQKGQQRRDRQE